MDADGGVVAVRRPHRSARRVARTATDLLVVLLAGNAVIVAAHVVLSRLLPGSPVTIPGVDHARGVSTVVLRGSAPGPAGWDALAALGVRTIVDLRAEADPTSDLPRLARLGLARIHLPVRDGRAPDPAVVARLADVVERADGRVYVHCGAGVGRTGAVVGAWEVRAGRRSPWGAAARALAVGPPSLEQLAAILLAGRTQAGRPGPVVVVVSRLLDAPRRIVGILRRRRR